MKKKKLVIVGTGKIAHEHIKVIKAFNDFEILSVFNRSKEKATNFAKKYKIKKVHDSIDKMINEINPDGILILVSFDQIYKVTKKIINYKIPFFVEKPPGLSVNQNVHLAKLCEQYKIKNMVGFNRRFYSIFQKGLKLLDKKGKILSFSIYGMERLWLYKGNKKLMQNMIMANSIHTIDLLSFFGGKKKIIKIISDSKKNKKFINCSLNIKFKNNMLGNYYINTESPYYWSVKIFTNDSTLVYDNLNEGYLIDKNFKRTIIKPDKYDLIYKPGLFKQFENFRKLILNKKIDKSAIDIKNSYQSIYLASKLNKDFLS